MSTPLTEEQLVARREHALLVISQIETLIEGLPWPVAETALTVILGKIITNVPEAKQADALHMVCGHVASGYAQALRIAAGGSGEQVH